MKRSFTILLIVGLCICSLLLNCCQEKQKLTNEGEGEINFWGIVDHIDPNYAVVILTEDISYPPLGIDLHSGDKISVSLSRIPEGEWQNICVGDAVAGVFLGSILSNADIPNTVQAVSFRKYQSAPF